MIVTNAAMFGAVIIESMVLARFISKPDYGALTQAMTITAIVGPIVGGIGANAVTFYIPRLDRSAQKSLVRIVIGIGLALGLVVSLGIALAAPALARDFSNPMLGAVLPWFSFYALVTFPALFYSSYLLAVGRVRQLSTFSLVSRAVIFVGIVGAIVGGFGLRGLLVAYLATNGLVFLYILHYIRRDFADVEARWRFDLIAPMLTYSLPLVLTSCLGTLFSATDRLVISFYFAPAVVAAYAIGAKEVPLFGVLNASISQVLAPEISRLHASDDHDGIRRIWRESMRKQSLAMFPAFCFFMVFAVEFIAVLYGRQYADSVGFFRIFLFLLPLRVATYGLLLSSTGRSRIVLYGAGTSLLVNIGLSIVLTILLRQTFPGYEAWGPAIATVLATYALVVFYMPFLRGVLGAAAFQAMPWGHFAKIFITSAAMATICACVKLLPLPAPARLGIAGVVYPTLLYVCWDRLMVLQDEDRVRLDRWIFEPLLRLLGRAPMAPPPSGPVITSGISRVEAPPTRS